MISLTRWGGLFFKTLQRDRKSSHRNLFHENKSTDGSGDKGCVYHSPTWPPSAAERSEPRCGRWWPRWTPASLTSTACVCNCARRKGRGWVTEGLAKCPRPHGHKHSHVCWIVAECARTESANKWDTELVESEGRAESQTLLDGAAAVYRLHTGISSEVWPMCLCVCELCCANLPLASSVSNSLWPSFRNGYCCWAHTWWNSNAMPTNDLKWKINCIQSGLVIGCGMVVSLNSN